MEGKELSSLYTRYIQEIRTTRERERERENGFHVQNTINISTVIIPDEYLVNLHINI